MENVLDETMAVTQGCDRVSRKRKAEQSPRRRSVNNEMNREFGFLQEQTIEYDSASDDEDGDAKGRPVHKRRRSDHVNDLAERNELYGSPLLYVAEIKEKPVPLYDRLYFVNTRPSPPSDMRPDTETDRRKDLSRWIDEQRRMLMHCSQDEVEDIKTFAQTCKRLVENRKTQLLSMRRYVGNEIREESRLERSTGDERGASDGKDNDTEGCKPVSKKCEIEHENDIVAEVRFLKQYKYQGRNETSHLDCIEVENEPSVLLSYWNNFQPNPPSVTQYPQDDMEEFRGFA